MNRIRSQKFPEYKQNVKLGNEEATLPATNSITLTFQSHIVPSLNFSENLDTNTYFLYVGTESLQYYKICFAIGPNLADAYIGTQCTHINISSNSRCFSLLHLPPNPTDDFVAMADDKNCINLIKLSNEGKLDPNAPLVYFIY